MTFKLVALDMDGTILNSKHEMSERTVNVLKECLKRDIKVVLASGREYNSIERYGNTLGVKDYQITLNGAVIFDPISKKSIKESLLTQEIYLELLNKIKEIPHPYIVYDQLCHYVDKNFKNLAFAKGMSKITGVKFPDAIERYEDVKNPTKIMMYILKKDLVKDIQKTIINENIKVMRTSERSLEIINNEANKANALDYICSEYGITKENVISFGDSENDIDMIKYAGKGIAMGNAFDHVKSISDHITKSNDEDGVAEAIEKFVLKEV